MTIIYNLYGTIYYDSNKECYKKIIKISSMPKGPLSNHIKKINNNYLSPFQLPGSTGPCCEDSRCILGIKKINDNELMCIDDIPELFTFLLNNGYGIDTAITKMIQKSNVKFNNDLICMISYS